MAASSGIIKDKIISESPEDRLVFTEPIPILVNSESNRFTVTRVEINLLDFKSTLMNPISPASNIDRFPCWSVEETLDMLNELNCDFILK